MDSLQKTDAQSPNDPKLSDGGGRRDACAAGSSGAGGVTTGAVRWSAWLGDVGRLRDLKTSMLRESVRDLFWVIGRVGVFPTPDQTLRLLARAAAQLEALGDIPSGIVNFGEFPSKQDIEAEQEESLRNIEARLTRMTQALCHFEPAIRKSDCMPPS